MDDTKSEKQREETEKANSQSAEIHPRGKCHCHSAYCHSSISFAHLIHQCLGRIQPMGLFKRKTKFGLYAANDGNASEEKRGQTAERDEVDQANLSSNGSNHLDRSKERVKNCVFLGVRFSAGFFGRGGKKKKRNVKTKPSRQSGGGGCCRDSRTLSAGDCPISFVLGPPFSHRLTHQINVAFAHGRR